MGPRGARPRTLPAAMVPVIVGVALIRPRTINWGNSVLCLVVALALQVGTNYANDYSDGIRGTDEARVGPFRLTASKLVAAKWCATPRSRRSLVAGGAGLFLASRTSWWLVRDRRHGDRRRMVLHRGTATVRVLRIR